MGKNLSKKDFSNYDKNEYTSNKECPKRHPNPNENFPYYQFQDDCFDFKITEDMNDLSNNANYELLPISVLHTIFLFVKLSDIASLMRSCSLFCEIINTQLFWKEYCFACKKNEVTKEEQKKVENWKFEFFKSIKNNDNKFLGKYEVGEQIFNDENLCSNFSFIKICLIGDDYCGKTSLIKRWKKGDEFHENEVKKTVYADLYQVKMKRIRDDFKIQLQLWDITREFKFFKSILRGTSAIVLCFSLDSEKSFKMLGEIMETEIDGNTIGETNSEFLLIGTKCDLKREVKTIEINKFLKKYPQIRSYIETSSKDKINTVTSISILFEISTLKEQRNNSEGCR